MTATAPIKSAPTGSPLAITPQSGFGLLTLRAASPLQIQLLPSGAVYAIRHRGTLVNQVLPGPAENGLGRLYLREWAEDAVNSTSTAEAGKIARFTPLAGAGLAFTHSDDAAAWNVELKQNADAADLLHCATLLQVHPRETAWRWRISVRNAGARARRVDVVYAQDVGLADEAVVRNNEAYVSQYIDWLPVQDGELGWTLLARQNQPMQRGQHPWLALACVPGAQAYGTDGTQFFGQDHRLTGEPAACREPRLPSTRLQYEFALAALQSRAITVGPGETAELTFVCRFVEDHPAASSADDLARLREVIAGFTEPSLSGMSGLLAPRSLFVTATWVHGDNPSDAELEGWFPGPHREIERDAAQGPLAFFCGADCHVVTRAKEAAIARPHGHLLRSGDAAWIDDAQFGVTVYAAGIFAAQSYVANSSLARLLPVVRNSLGAMRASGQRIFVRQGDAWRQLGVPSAFAMTPGNARWIYRLGGLVIEVRVWCAKLASASFLDVRLLAGAPCEFLVTHELALGAQEFDAGGAVEFVPEAAAVSCVPARESFTARHLPGLCFAIAAVQPDDGARFGGDECLYDDGERRNGPYVVYRTGPTRRCGLIQIGSTKGPESLPGLVAGLRAEFAKDMRDAPREMWVGCPHPASSVTSDTADAPPANDAVATGALPPKLAVGEPAPLPLRLAGTSDPGVARLNEIVPWFNHNAAIHFSAPHGLEQYSGAAWGVRDVCQGSLEWLLAAERFDAVRRMLTAVFAQQYYSAESDTAALTGTWPQWFMFQPFHAIQQAHSHGDVCFWPVKALCDYVEASGDVHYLATVVGYTNPRTFNPAGPLETLWSHCDRVIAHVESRFVRGTALVNYGDGDWDDTLQPADPAMRTRMISGWTVALAYQTLGQLAQLCRHGNEPGRAARLDALRTRMRADFEAQLMPDGVVAGFAIVADNGAMRPLLHPRDQTTHLRYRLLPMTRAILAELFTPAEAQRHLTIIETELRYPDGVRLMSSPVVYRGGVETLFKRGETAANVGREIGLQYVHAHLRYAEALAKVGDADRFWHALQVVNPVGLSAVVPNAAPRQSNVYFSSSDADFADRYEAQARWHELRFGRVAVRGGWRLYSSGPGLFLHKVRTCLLGLRGYYDDVVFDPVLPHSLDGLEANVEIRGVPVTVAYHVTRTHGPSAIVVNGAKLEASRVANPYRTGGLKIATAQLSAMLKPENNRIEIHV